MKKISTFTALFFCFWTSLNAQLIADSKSFLSKKEVSKSTKLTAPPALRLPFDASEYDDYGGKLGIGISIFNGFAVPFRYYVNPKNVVEASIGSAGVAIFSDDGQDLELESIESGFLFGAGYTFFNNRFLKEKKKRNKVRAHGVAVRANHLFGNFKTTYASLGWAMETFKENRKGSSFIFELGLQGTFPDFVYNGRVFEDARPGIYLRCHWNFFLK